MFKKNNAPKRIGLLGGSFDPPHIGHIEISQSAINILYLDEVWWVVAKQNPFKGKYSFSFEDRIKMSETITNYNKIIISDIERKISSFCAYDVIKYIIEQNPDSKFYWIMGSDLVEEFHNWYRAEDISKIIEIAIFSRNGYNPSQSVNKIPNSNFYEVKLTNISSTEIKNKINLL